MSFKHIVKNTLIALFYFINLHLSASTYYLDAVNGNDSSGDGSENSPYKTLSFISDKIVGGDVVILAEGEYEGWDDLNKVKPYSDWITIKGANNKASIINFLKFGHWDLTKKHSKFLRFENITIKNTVILLHANHTIFSNVHFKDGVNINACNNITISNSIIERIGPWIGNEENISKDACKIERGKFITLENNEITRTANAISITAENSIIKNNHIHDITHDGIRIISCRKTLVEGNLIHGLDDGVTDQEASWSKHCDAIHIFIKGGPCENIIPNYDITFRGNVVYDVESQLVQFNNILSCVNEGIFNEKFLFENNIFGPTKKNINVFNSADKTNDIIFRNNAMMYFPEGRIYKSPYREFFLDSYVFRLSEQCEDVYVYNNIFHDVGKSNGFKYYDHNLFLTNTQNRPLKRFSILDENFKFISPEKFDGIPVSNNSILNKGSAVINNTKTEYDLYNIIRDIRPDIGVIELPNQTPDPETNHPEKGDEAKLIFIDDFTDGDLDLDPWLYDYETQGISWSKLIGNKYTVSFYKDLKTNTLTPPINNSQYITVTDQGKNWKNYKLNFDAFNKFQKNGGGPVMLFIDLENYYFLDIGSEKGELWRIMNGKEDLIFKNEAISLPHKGVNDYTIKITQSETGINFTINTNYKYTDSNPNAIKKFKAGKIGIKKNYNTKHHNILYDNFRIEVQDIDQTLSSEDIFKKSNLFYPNPTKEILNLPWHTNWRLYSLSGKFLKQGNSKEINMLNLSKGIYILKTEKKNVKIIKM
ncbi:T9SS type A sorting domain-containing protein [Tenacibaculum sp. M341]|uniref:T9SS type A sorting domain-containing protein n=1 Tax=Tenacibaculum sp. M341 TaxID=2530339 RepID=UPI001046E39B|nr:T9SS type A sorting domain-containing protein [Tenacibaculum sp. M341]TCI92645.1 T9SS type A sorting domain-containing protein [Tenacibaculum sp. M341]